MKNVILIAGILLMVGTSCSSYVCPTYSKADKQLQPQKVDAPVSKEVRI